MFRRILTPALGLVLVASAGSAIAADNYNFRYSAADLRTAQSAKILLRKIERTAGQHCIEVAEAERSACEDKVVNDIVSRIDDKRLNTYASRRK